MIKLPPREDWFKYILGFSALFVASIAAFFSVMGIGMLFSGAAISAMVMASSLELGKIVSVSFLYRYWDKATRFLRIYLSVAVLILIVITSLGVFGWLSSAYQSSAMKYEMGQQQISMMAVQRESIDSQVKQEKQRLDGLMKIRNDQEARMNESLNNPILSRNPTALRQFQEQNISLIKQTDVDLTTEKESYNRLIKEVMDIDKKIMESKIDSSKTKDVITFKFVAEALGWELNSTVKWFIVVIIVVFDPLAVCLILAYNVAVFGSTKRTLIIPSEPVLTSIEVPEPKLSVEPTDPIQPTTSDVSTKKILLNEVPMELASKPLLGVTKNHGLRESELLHTPSPEPVRR